MAWTAPMTAVSNSIWTNAQFNTYIRDNLLETMPAKATAAGRYFASTAANSIDERIPSSTYTDTSETTTSTTYTGLATATAVSSLETGTKALVLFSCKMAHSALDIAAAASVAVSGSTTIAASDDWRVAQAGIAAAKSGRAGMVHMFTTLNAGSNTFTMQFKVQSAGTGTFQRRELIVLPL